MSERPATYEERLAEVERRIKSGTYTAPIERGWPGEPRDCFTCVNEDRRWGGPMRGIVHCKAGEMMRDPAPCPKYEKNKRTRLKEWLL